MKSEAWLWSAIVVGPVAWFLNLEASFALAPLACSGGGKTSLYLVSGVSLILAAFGGTVSFEDVAGQLLATLIDRSDPKQDAAAFELLLQVARMKAVDEPGEPGPDRPGRCRRAPGHEGEW